MSEIHNHHPRTAEKKKDDIIEVTPPKETYDAKERHLVREQVEHDHSIDKIQASIHEAAISGKDISIEHHPDAQPILGLQRELKAASYKKTLKGVQTKLHPVERTFSKLIHQPLVESVSEVGSKTVARPSGLLGGGLAALVGSGMLLYMAKRYGFEYNYFVFIVLFLSGFAAGFVIEVVATRAFRR